MSRGNILAGLLTVVALGACVAVYLHGANIPVLQPHGPVARGELWVMTVTLLLCAVVVIPVFVMLFSFAWMFRADRPRSRRWHMPDWDHYSVEMELIWWIVPSIIIAILSVIAWRSSHQYDPYRALGRGAPLEIQVVALDWKWLFIYPQQGIASVNMVEFPENVPVRFVLTADAPMNSFWIPSLGGQIMVMPGMTTQLNLLANDRGTYTGLSGNLSGRGFAGMTFAAQSVTQAEFDQWVASIHDTSLPLDSTSYKLLAKPSENDPVAFYAPVDSALYGQIVMKSMMPEHEMMQGMMQMPNGMMMNESSMP
ncbi:MAG: cyoA [Candidatus Kaiserbacteria bacterium]|nr:cyoA [Candidatus Kaiserbacteria bacterium]